MRQIEYTYHESIDRLVDLRPLVRKVGKMPRANYISVDRENPRCYNVNVLFSMSLTMNFHGRDYPNTAQTHIAMQPWTERPQESVLVNQGPKTSNTSYIYIITQKDWQTLRPDKCDFERIN